MCVPRFSRGSSSDRYSRPRGKISTTDHRNRSEFPFFDAHKSNRFLRYCLCRNFQEPFRIGFLSKVCGVKLQREVL